MSGIILSFVGTTAGGLVFVADGTLSGAPFSVTSFGG